MRLRPDIDPQSTRQLRPWPRRDGRGAKALFLWFLPTRGFLRSFNETLVASDGFGDSTLAQLRLQRGHDENTAKRLGKQKSILATEQEKRSEWPKSDPTPPASRQTHACSSPLPSTLVSILVLVTLIALRRRVFGLFGNVNERTRWRWRRWRRKLLETCLVRH